MSLTVFTSTLAETNLLTLVILFRVSRGACHPLKYIDSLACVFQSFCLDNATYMHVNYLIKLVLNAYDRILIK